MPNELAILHVAPIWGDPSQGLTEAIQALALAQRELSREVRLLSTAPFKPDGLKKQLEVLWIRDLSSAEQKRLIEEADLVVFHSTYIWAHRRLSHQARSPKKKRFFLIQIVHFVGSKLFYYFLKLKWIKLYSSIGITHFENTENYNFFDILKSFFDSIKIYKKIKKKEI